VVGTPLSTEDTALEATLAPLLAALPAALAALLAALPAALAADEPMLEALDAMSLVASWACEQLTVKAAVMAMPPAAAAARANVVFIPWFSLLLNQTVLHVSHANLANGRVVGRALSAGI
jgi:hypothetical protein